MTCQGLSGLIGVADSSGIDVRLLFVNAHAWQNRATAGPSFLNSSGDNISRAIRIVKREFRCPSL